MNAVVLVGGGGTRLRPLTYAVPKPLIPVVNRPLITHLLANLRRHGVSRVVMAASASDKRIEEALGDGSGLGLSLEYAYETEPLGSGLAVKQAAAHLDGAFFVCNGDVLANVNLSEMAQRHQERGATMSIFLALVEDPGSFGIADIDDDNRITRFIEKPSPGQTRSRWANAGTWLFQPEVLDHIPDEKMDGSIERLVMPSLIADDGLVLGYPSDAYWMDVGTPERYLTVHRDLLSGRIPEEPNLSENYLAGDDCQIWPDAEIGPRVLLGSGCRIGGRVKITGPSVLGDNCTVRDNAVIEGSIIWAGAKIGSGARVRNSIIGDGCLVGDGCILEDSVLANGAKVQRNAHLSPGARLEPDEVAG